MARPVNHLRALRVSAELTSYFVPGAISPIDVMQALNEARISFGLVGAHARMGWMRKPRATQDVDVVVAGRQVKKAVRFLCEAYSHLEPIELPGVVSLRNRETRGELVDIVKPLLSPYREVFRHTHTIQAEGLTFRMPSLEMVLAMRFVALTSTTRDLADKYLDAHDFIRMVRENVDELDEGKLEKLGCLLYDEGGKDLRAMVDKVRRGEKLTL